MDRRRFILGAAAVPAGAVLIPESVKSNILLPETPKIVEATKAEVAALDVKTLHGTVGKVWRTLLIHDAQGQHVGEFLIQECYVEWHQFNRGPDMKVSLRSLQVDPDRLCETFL